MADEKNGIENGNSGKASEIYLGDDFGDVAIRVNGVTVEVRADGSVVHPAANDARANASPEIGSVGLAGEHKGEIYGGLYPADNKPIWFLAAPKMMDHYKAAAWAEGQGGSLPTRKQGDYLTTLKGKGGTFADIFNRGNSFRAGSVWLAEPLHPHHLLRLVSAAQRRRPGHLPPAE